MAATVEEIAAELEPETRAALIDNMKFFNDIAGPQDVGLDVADFEVSAAKGDAASQVPRADAMALPAAELAREMEERGATPTGFHSADAKALQKLFDEERAAKIAQILESYAETLETEKAALTKERNKTVMARLLAGEITSFEGDEKQHVRTFCRLLLAHQTKPRASFAILSAASPPLSLAPRPPLAGSSSSGGSGGALPLRPGSRGKLAALGGSASSYVSPDAAWAGGGSSASSPSLGGSSFAAWALRGPSALASTTARVVAKCLAANRSLLLLDLSEAGIDDLGGCFLARALKHNGTLEHLALRGNHLGPRSLVEFARALTPPEAAMLAGPSSSPSGGDGGSQSGGPETHADRSGGWAALRGLNLEANPNLTLGGSDSAGVKAFAAMLTANATLRTLSFFRTDLGDFGVRLLAEGLRANTSVHTCDVGCTGDTTGHTTREVAEALKLNQAGLAALKASDQVAGHARAKDASAAAAAAAKEARRVAYLQWMEAEKARRVEDRLRVFEEARAARLEAEAKQHADATRAAEAKAAAEAGASKKKKGKKKK